MIRYILTDIEGTTTSVSFVYEVLFPYFSAHFKEFVEQNTTLPALATQLAAVKATVAEEQNREISDEQAVEQLLVWTLEDRKHPALKALQGLVWEEGYKAGAIKGHIYPDVPPCLRDWKKQNIKLGIYSSGSVHAQKLLFGSSDFGDLTPLFSHYFDTGVGGKREVASYHNIQKELGIPARNILFLSDIEAELDAAKTAGFRTLQLVRGNTVASVKHRHVANFTASTRYILSLSVKERAKRSARNQNDCCGGSCN